MIGSMLCLLHEYAMQQRKSFVRHSRVKKNRRKFKVQFANSVAHCCELYFRREVAAVAAVNELAASTYMMKPGVVTAIRGSRKDVVEAIVGAILMQWMENGGLYRTSIGTF